LEYYKTFKGTVLKLEFRRDKLNNYIGLLMASQNKVTIVETIISCGRAAFDRHKLGVSFSTSGLMLMAGGCSITDNWNTACTRLQNYWHIHTLLLYIRSSAFQGERLYPVQSIHESSQFFENVFYNLKETKLCTLFTNNLYQWSLFSRQKIMKNRNRLISSFYPN